LVAAQVSPIKISRAGSKFDWPSLGGGDIWSLLFRRMERLF
jgi:hypothetical protein